LRCGISDFGGPFKFENAFYIQQFEIKLVSMDKKELQDRLKKYAIAIIKFSESLPDKSGFRTVKNQIVRCGPSAAANYRAACRAKSTKDYISKMETVEEELDETMFWLEFTVGLSEEYRLKVALL
jgi:four helix bundle protein